MNNAHLAKKTKPFRLLFIAPQPFYEDRGTPIVILEELKCLSNLGFVVDVLTYPVGQNIAINHVEFIRTKNPLKFKYIPIGFSWRKIFLDFILLLTALPLARRKKYDTMHGVEDGALIGMVLKWLFGTPMVYDMHSSIPEQLANVFFFKKGPGNYLAKYLEKLLIKNATVVMASKGLMPLISAVKPGCAIKEWVFDVGHTANNSGVLAKKLNIVGKPVVAYIGNFADYQGVGLLIDAILRVRDVIGNVMLLLVGGTENEISVLKKRVQTLCLSDSVILIKRVSRVQVADYFSIADVLSLPRPRGENAPLKIYEYAKSGKPIVATDIPAHGLLAHNPNAVLVKPETSALVDGIIQALTQRQAPAGDFNHNTNHTQSHTSTLPVILSDFYYQLSSESGVNAFGKCPPDLA